MKIKKGVRITKLSKEMYYIWGWMERWFTERGMDCIVTSAPERNALDFRTRRLGPMELSSLETKLDRVKGYALVIEQNHIHIEYQPKAGEKVIEEVD